LALIKSISGMRGTIGGSPGTNLTPLDIVEMTAAYARLIRENQGSDTPLRIIIGRDARMSGEMVASLCMQTLLAMGIHVLDAGLSTTPSVEMAVKNHNAHGGIIVTASHNPREWNALKFLNKDGEFISGLEGAEIMEIANQKLFEFVPIDQLGKIESLDNIIEEHIQAIFQLPLVKVDLVQSCNYKVVVDCINSTGAISIAPLLAQMGCKVILINGEMTGDFTHNPEPLPAHLTELSEAVIAHRADLGIAVDPDVDRLSFVCPDGTLLGEENTLVGIARYVLDHTPGATVSNLSSTRGLRDITLEANQLYYAAAVGEVNVVNKMKEVNAVIGGEGNGGVIYPALHYGRDALLGVALMLSYMAMNKYSLLDIKQILPEYYISKNKINLQTGWDTPTIINHLAELYREEEISREDGLKIDFPDGWVQLRVSNTEPIIRVYSEAGSIERAEALSAELIANFNKLTIS